MPWTDFYLRLRALLSLRRAERDLDEELRFHLEMQARKNVEAGMPPGDAVRRAALDFGGFELAKEECRDRRGLTVIETVVQDARYALRGFLRAPVFSVTVIATIAVALGLNTALFTLFDAYLLRPLAVRDPDSLYTWSNAGGGDRRFSWQEFEDFQSQTRAFSELAGSDNLITHSSGHLLLGNLVTGNYFQMLGVQAAMGRTLLPEDAAGPRSSPVMVLSFGAWRNKFRGDPAIVGSKVVIRGFPLEVIGVAPADFTGLVGIPIDYWTPLTFAPQLTDGPNLFGSGQPSRIRVTGRLRPGWSARRAEAEFDAWSQHRASGRPGEPAASRTVLHSQSAPLPLDPAIIAAFSPMIAGFALILVIACVNVANMMLARAMARQREIAVRLALGASRRRLLRQLLTESVLLAVPAAVAGLVLSRFAIASTIRVILATIPAAYREFITLAPHALDWRVFVFMMMAAIAAAVLFGLAPALEATRTAIPRAASGARLRNGLVIAQVGASALFLICAALLLGANQRFQKLDYGLQTADVIEIQANQALGKTIPRLLSDPAVAGLAAASKVPLDGVLPWTRVTPEGAAISFNAGYLYASPEYLSILRIPLMRGRTFTAAEASAGAPVAIISRHTAELLWPGGDPLGQTFHLPREASLNRQIAQRHAPLPDFPSARVIGIAADALNGWLGDGRTDYTCIYFPRALSSPGNVLLVRVKGNLEAARLHLEAVLQSSIPGGAEEIHSLEETANFQLYPWRALYWIMAAVGGLALLLTISGLYGVLSYLVTQRTREIGIRIALGAGPARAAAVILSQSLRLAAIGSAIGALGALALLRVLASGMDMRMIGTFDAVAFGGGFLLLQAASALAAWLPARRAAGIEPVSALRRDES